MKMAVQYWRNQGQSERTRFIAFEGAYHGDTLGTMSVSDPTEGMHAEWKGMLLPQHVVPLPFNESDFARFDAFLETSAAGVAAVLIEPLIQGAGGMKTHSAAVLTRIARTARAHGLLVIFDEIFVGFGRAGSLFAMLQAQELPDIVCLGKALSRPSWNDGCSGC